MPTSEAKQRALNKAYDQYVKRHGLIGTAKSDFLSNDTEFPVAMSLETPVTTIKDTVVKTGPKKGHVRQMSVTEFKKADIFTTRTVFPFVEPKTASSLDDAINLSLTYRNKVDVDYIAELTVVDPKKAREDLIASGEAFENPDTGLVESKGRVSERQREEEARRGARSGVRKQCQGPRSCSPQGTSPSTRCFFGLAPSGFRLTLWRTSSRRP